MNLPIANADIEPQLTPIDDAVSPDQKRTAEGCTAIVPAWDFYEMFFEDAQIGAQLFNVALTKRGMERGPLIR